MNSPTEDQILAQEMAKLHRGNVVGENEVKNESSVYEELAAPFPDEAMSKDKSRGFALTSVKAQYVIERLNTVLGVMNWTFGGEFKETEDGVLYMGSLIISINGKQNRHFAPGYCSYVTVNAKGEEKTKLLGDVYKSAHTDSLSKCASKIGVANDVFKGLIDANSIGSGASTARSKKKASSSSSTTRKKASSRTSSSKEVEEAKPTSFQQRTRSRRRRGLEE